MLPAARLNFEEEDGVEVILDTAKLPLALPIFTSKLIVSFNWLFQQVYYLTSDIENKLESVKGKNVMHNYWTNPNFITVLMMQFHSASKVSNNTSNISLAEESGTQQ